MYVWGGASIAPCIDYYCGALPFHEVRKQLWGHHVTMVQQLVNWSTHPCPLNHPTTPNLSQPPNHPQPPNISTQPYPHNKLPLPTHHTHSGEVRSRSV